jgi:hypothetical protein
MDAAKCFLDSVIGAATAELDAALLLLFNQQYAVAGMGYEILKLKVCGEGGPSVDTAKDITVTTAKGVLEAMKAKALNEAEKSLLQKALGALNAALAAAVCDVKAIKCLHNKEDTLAFPKGCNVKHEEKLTECAPPASCNPSRCTCFDTGGCPLISRCGGGPDTHQTGIVDCEKIEGGEATTDDGRTIACVSHFNQFWKRCNEPESCPSSADAGDAGDGDACEGREDCHFEDLPTTECKNGLKHRCHNMSTRCDDGTVCNATKNCGLVTPSEACD